jgi:3-hydroxyisobutyrate dehydrogenase-like beta-hydroxyacid dehydrogenase
MANNEIRVGWVGAGKMGLPMLNHLLKAGHPVHVYDPNAVQVQVALSLGATAATSPADAAAGDVAFTFSSLPHDDAFLQAALAHDGVIAKAPRGSIYVDTSTVSPTASALVAKAAAKAGVRYLRATVSGNNGVAQAGQLTVMVSGPKDAYDEALPLLKQFGVKHFHVGLAEEARLMKLVINLMISVSAGMMAEALTLGRSGGLDWQQMLEVMESSAVASPMVKYKTPALKVRDFTSTMSAIAQIKDIDLILDAAKGNGVPMALTGALRQMYQSMISRGGGEEDYIAIVKHVEHSAGLRTDSA